MTTTLLELDERLCRETGDFIQATATTAINADLEITSTTLRNHDHGRDDYFANWWVYIEDKANLGVSRLVQRYTTATGKLEIFGAVLVDDAANLATFRLSRSNWVDRKDVLNRAIEEVYPHLHKTVDDRTLISDNALPDAHFENWSSTSALRLYTASNVTLAKTSTAGLTRGGTYSAYAKATAGNGYFYISSDSYPKLLDLRNATIDFKCWAYPETNADDAKIEIYTIKPDGTTTQTLTSTTANYKGKFNLLKLESQAINDDIAKIEFRFKVVTNAGVVYFDDARVNGKSLYEYLLPEGLFKGSLDQVEYQTSGNSDDICDDISLGVTYEPVFDWDTFDDGAYKYLRINEAISSEVRLRLIGTTPLESLSAGTDTISLDGHRLNLLIAYAAYLLYQKLGSPVTSDDTTKYERELAKFYGKYVSLLSSKMPTKPMKIRVEPL